MNDHLIRIISKEAGIRAFACDTTRLAQEGTQRHSVTHVAAEAFGKGLTGAALLGALLKVKQRLSLKIEGVGAMRTMIVDSDSYGRVRGYFFGDLGALDEIDIESVPQLIGRGKLIVVKDLLLADLAESAIPLVDSTIDGDLTHYLNSSEQTPSLVDISVVMDEDGGIKAAGGLLLQALPGQELNAIELLHERIEEMPPLAQLLLDGQEPRDVLHMLLHDIDYTFLEERALQFKCGCSRERSEQALLSLGSAEIQSIRDTDGEVTIDCRFCHEQYRFDHADLERLLEQLDA